MEIRDEFEKDWRSTYSDDPLPHLRFLTTTDYDELTSALISDEHDLIQSKERLQKELDTVTFNLEWVTKKKEEVAVANAENDENYANVSDPIPHHAGPYMNSKNIGGKPMPRPRSGLAKAKSANTLPRMPPLPSGKGIASDSSVKRTSSLNLRRPPGKVDLDSPVTDEQCRTLSHMIDNSYKTFGQQILKFTESEIEMCRKFSSEGNKQAMRMLAKWKQRMGCSATLRALVGLLKDFGYGPEIWGFLEYPEKYDPLNSPMHPAERNPEFEPYQATIVKGYFTSTPDELSVKKGDTITIQDRGRDSWLFGEINGLRGWVPGNCVSSGPEAKQTNGSSRFLYVVEAISDSNCFKEGFMDFRKGEILDVLEETIYLTTKCYRTRNRDGLIGLAPQRECKRVFRKTSVLHDREWYHAGLSRGQTEALLRPCPHGTYLVRDASKAPENFVLCVKNNGEVASLMMHTENDTYKVSTGQFSSIQGAIDYYRRNVIRDRLILTMPAPKHSY